MKLSEATELRNASVLGLKKKEMIEIERLEIDFRSTYKDLQKFFIYCIENSYEKIFNSCSVFLVDEKPEQNNGKTLVFSDNEKYELPKMMHENEYYLMMAIKDWLEAEDYSVDFGNSSRWNSCVFEISWADQIGAEDFDFENDEKVIHSDV